ncbi:MAG: L,D-transpeptidase family protein [Fimbriimonadales bacterium]|nr:L,D-transpeptidase family protein [Fimbriimonadales bacterium]
MALQALSLASKCVVFTSVVVATAVTYSGQRTVADVLKNTRPKVETKFKPLFLQHQLTWPPKNLVLVALKREKKLEVWAHDDGTTPKLVATYDILAASGGLGPKRKEGDRQVPEGFYNLSYLNPNSRYHLSVFIDYPNKEDIAHSKVPRYQMGGEIFVHGRAVSIGCIAIGDAAIEEVFTLCALTPSSKRRIVISPVDFRKEPEFAMKMEESWVQALHHRIKQELQSKFMR